MAGSVLVVGNVDSSGAWMPSKSWEILAKSGYLFDSGASRKWRAPVKRFPIAMVEPLLVCVWLRLAEW